VFLVGRIKARLQAVADGIKSSGGKAFVAELDALDERAVDEHVKDVVAKAGSVDLSFNLITRGDAQGTPLVQMGTAGLFSRSAPEADYSDFNTDRMFPAGSLNQAISGPRPAERPRAMPLVSVMPS
jgi:NAD(P)-dependent dehydrogenase (short-subunit alcohol dehydrogenase family)